MKYIIAIIDEDERYAARLCAYMNKKKWIELKAENFSDVEDYRQRSKDCNTEILLLSERAAVEWGHAKRPETTVLLLEGNICERELSTNLHPINKYISAEILLKQIMEKYVPSGDHILIHTNKSEAEIIGIFSPIRRCGKTGFSAAMAMQKAKTSPTLLLSLDEYQGIFQNDAGYASDLSDVLYMYKQGRYSWDRLSIAVHSAYGIDYIPPARYPEDIAELSIVEVGDLIRTIARESRYEVIVMDFGFMGKRAYELLKLCTILYMPVLAEEMSSRRVDEFFAYMESTGREGIKEKVQMLYLPFPKTAAEQKLQGLAHSEIMRFVQEMAGGAYALANE